MYVSNTIRIVEVLLQYIVIMCLNYQVNCCQSEVRPCLKKKEKKNTKSLQNGSNMKWEKVLKIPYNLFITFWAHGILSVIGISISNSLAFEIWNDISFSKSHFKVNLAFSSRSLVISYEYIYKHLYEGHFSENLFCWNRKQL